MTEVNNAETESVGESSVSSQKAEIKDSNERKIKDLQFQNRELKNWMLAMMEKSNQPRQAKFRKVALTRNWQLSIYALRDLATRTNYDVLSSFYFDAQKKKLFWNPCFSKS